MKFKINNKYFRWGLTAFLVVAAGIAFYYFMFHSYNIRAGIRTITNILMPVVVGMAIAYLLTPVLNFLEKKLFYPLAEAMHVKDSKKKKSVIRGVSILCTTFLFIEVIYLLIHMLVSQIVPSVQNIIGNFDAYTTNITRWLNQTLDNNPEAGAYLTKIINSFSAELEKWMINILPNTAEIIKTVSMSVLGVVGFLWNFIIGFIISIYVLASKEKFAGQAKKIAYALFEQDTANIVIRNFRFTHKTFIGFLGGKIVDSIIIGILCFIGTSILKTPYAALVSVIVGVTNVIPFFGPYLGAIPSTILIFIVDPIHPLNCLYFVIFILILQQVDGNIIGPKILGESTGLTGFWVIFAITFFGGLFGVIGMIVGVPIFAVIYAAIRSVINTMLRKKEMPTESKKYEKLDFVDQEGLHELPQAAKRNKRSKRKEKDKTAQEIVTEETAADEHSAAGKEECTIETETTKTKENDGTAGQEEQ